MSVELANQKLFNKQETNKSISNKAFGSLRAFYRVNFNSLVEEDSPFSIEHFNIENEYLYLNEKSLPHVIKIFETGITEKFKSSDCLSDIMGEETYYKKSNIVEEQKNYQESKQSSKKESGWYEFRHLPVQESITFMGKVEIEEFDPKLCEE